MAKILKINRKLFICLYTFFMLSITIPLLHQFTGSFIKIMLVWGFAIVVLDVLKRRDMYKNLGIKILLLFLFFSGLTILIHFKDNFIGNLTSLFYSSILLLVVYTDQYGKTKKEASRDFEHYSLWFCFLVFVCSTISIVMFAIQFSMVDGSYRYGFYMGRLWGVYTSPNAGGMCALVSIVLSFVSMLINKEQKSRRKTILKIFYIINIVFQTVYISLTDSNGTKLTIIASAIIFGFLWFFFIHKNRVDTVKKMFISISVGLLLSAICITGVVILGKAVSYLPAYIKNVQTMVSSPKDENSEVSKNKESAVNEKIEASRIDLSEISEIEDDGNLTEIGIDERSQEVYEEANKRNDVDTKTDIPKVEDEIETSVHSQKDKQKLESVDIGRRYENFDGGSGRFDLWKIGFRIFKKNPILGVGQANIGKEALKNGDGINEELVNRAHTGMHNVFLQVLVSHGVIGLILFVSFFVNYFATFIKKLKKKKCLISMAGLLVFTMITAMFFNNLMESTIYLCQSGITVMFWLMLGYLPVLSLNYDDNSEDDKIVEKDIQNKIL